MNKTQQNLVKYVTVLNEVVSTTEENGEKMSPYYETIKEAIEKNDLSAISAQRYVETKKSFDEGVANYGELKAKLDTVRAPARAMGMSTKFKVAYQAFFTACQDMANSIDDKNAKVDVEAFLDSEKRQDEASAEISNWVQKISRTLM